MNKLLKHSLIIFSIFLVLGVVILSILGFTNVQYYCDACFITGSCAFFVGLLVLVGDLGAFDLFGYSFYYLGRSFKTKQDDKKYENYRDYIDKKEESRKHRKKDFLPFLFVGLFFIIVSLIILLFI